MRRTFAGALSTLVLVLGGCTSQEEVTTLPEVTLNEFDGAGKVTLSELKGPLVVNLFASWCDPCRTEMPILEEFHVAYGDRIEIIGVDHKDPRRDKAEALVEESGATYRLLDDARGDLDRAAPFPSTRGLPFWAYVDAEGTVTHMEFAEIGSVEELVDLVDTHLGVAL